MAEGSYEQACMRAELLGLDKPNEEEFRRHTPQSQQNIDDNISAQFEDISLQNEDLKQAGGGLNELNTILSGTQRKLNKLKGMYGSLTDIIRNKITGSRDNISYSTDPSYLPQDGAGCSGTGANINEGLTNLDAETTNRDSSKREDINVQVASQVSKLDSLIDKADVALCSMEHQNKQMKSFIRK